MTSLVTMTTTPAKETLFHVLSNGLYEMFLAGSIDFIFFFRDFLTFFYKEPVLNVPECGLGWRTIKIKCLKIHNKKW